MAAFDYVALDPHGKRLKGVLDADSARAARKELRQRRLTLLKLNEAKDKQTKSGVSLGSGSKLTNRDLVVITRQLSMLIRSGAPVEEALDAVAAQSRSAYAKRTLTAVRTSVQEGFRLSDAMAQRKGAFSELYRAVVAAGEASGDLGAVLERMSDFLEQSEKMRQQAAAAMVYPIVLAVVASAVMTALMVVVVPRVVEQFQSLSADLPTITLVVISISEALQRYGLFVLGGLAVGILAFSRAMKVDAFRRAVDGFILRLPVIGPLVRSAGSARFARTMSTLVSSGAPVLESLAAARATADNLVLQDAVDTVSNAVREGGSLSTAMGATGAFPTLLVYMSASGERGGDLAAMFEKGAEYLESEFQSATTIALKLLEPAIIVVMGALVAMILLAIMLPILQLNTLALG